MLGINGGLYQFWHGIINLFTGWNSIAALISIGAFVLWYFTPAILGQGKQNILLMIAVGAGAYSLTTAYISVHAYDNGYNDAIAFVNKMNAGASDAAKQAVKKVQDCVAGNGTWDTISGTCTKDSGG